MSNRLSLVDRVWFRLESRRDPVDIVGLLLLGGEVDEARLRETLEERVLCRRRFRSRIVEAPHKIGAPRWSDEEKPSLDAHLTCRRLPPPGGDAELSALVSELANEPIDFSRSPWRVCLIRGGARGSILFAQLHHSMGDGFALVDVLMSLTDASPDGREHRPHRLPSSVCKRRRLTRVEALRGARRIGQGVMDFGHLVGLPFDPKTLLRRKPAGMRRFAWSNAIALERIRALAKQRHATVNDVLMAALSGALRRYFLEHGANAKPFRAIVPINLRPSSRPIDEEHGNWFGLLFVDLPILEPDREKRLSDLRYSMMRIKKSEEPLVSLVLLNVLGALPAALEHAVNAFFTRKASIVVTNVPGPRQPLYLAGQCVRDLMFWVPHPSGLSCGVSILSYAGNVRIGVRSDSAVVSDPERMAQSFEDEIADWERAAASS